MNRIIIVHWDKSLGPDPVIQFPPEGKFPSNDLLLKIWALHELDKESSMIEFIPEIDDEQYISLIQNYEGELYFIIIVYNRNDLVRNIIKDYPDILAVVGKNLIELVNTNKITRAISEAFQTIKNYSIAEKEENILNFFKDKIKSTILKILQDGAISKDDLREILRQDYGFSTTNIDLLLISFIHEDLIVKKNVSGSRECYFLIRDLSCIRVPPINFPEVNPDELAMMNDYKQNIANFYETYSYDSISESETKKIINYLINKDVYSLIKKLRERSLSVSLCLDILNNKEDLFNELLEEKILYEVKGLVYLFSDIRFIKFTPYYVIEKLLKRYKSQELSLNEFLTHLELLTELYKKNTSLIDYEII
jgi:hypothetical protein